MILTVGDLLQMMRGALTEKGIAAARHEAACLIRARCSLSLASIYTHPETPVEPAQAEQLHEDLERRLNHEPIAYILGETEFYGLPFMVGNGVLVPRPDTERLVETALTQLTQAFPTDKSLRILDTCAGSGCVGLSLAFHLRQQNRPFALDLVEKDPVAARYARKNAESLGLQPWTKVMLADLWPSQVAEPGGMYDLITANPPYIRCGEIGQLMPDVRCFEPRLALDGGEDGLDFYRRILGTAPVWLKRPGLLLFEHGFDQAASLERLCSGAGLRNLISVCDYGGHPRVTGGWLGLSDMPAGTGRTASQGA
jgi:release factor glutamine methyltransferase